MIHSNSHCKVCGTMIKLGSVMKIWLANVMNNNRKVKKNLGVFTHKNGGEAVW